MYFLSESCAFGSLFVLLFILSIYVCFFPCTGCLFECVCAHVRVCACLLHSQRRLISPAGPVRLFLGALSSQLEATAVTCLPNISPLLSSPLLLFSSPPFFSPLSTYFHVSYNIGELWIPKQQLLVYCGAIFLQNK